MNHNASITIFGAVVAMALAAPVSADGNRYDLERFYKSEISVSEAYLAMEHSKDFMNAPGEAKPVLIDVRSLREYASGHPEDAYNVPYPNVFVSNDQDAATFYWEVYKIVNGRTDTPIMTLCRTGHRSVLAGNILAKPNSNPKTAGLPPFTNVRNVWEGFVGQPRYAFVGGNILLPPYQLDLNNDGILNSDTADVYIQTKDANPDKDGWRNFAGLPWTIKIQMPLAYQRSPGLYSALMLTPVSK